MLLYFAYLNQKKCIVVKMHQDTRKGLLTFSAVPVTILRKA